MVRDDDIQPSSRAALLLLVAVNLLPLVGVMQWGWSVFDIVFLYWCENLIIGGVVVLKMVFCFPDLKSGAITIAKAGGRKITLPVDKLPAAAMQLIKLILVPFFIFHYGMFCMGHGVFIFALFDDAALAGADTVDIIKVLNGPLLWALVALLVSHLCSFFSNYLANGEFRRTSPPELMMSPYSRIIVMHLTILGGAGLTLFLGSPLYLLVLLIVLKILLDVRAHRQERKRLAESQTQSSQQFKKVPQGNGNFA
jgi:hypothetical protein